ncbi:hypothetical protein BVY03_01820 [bacterium K02(2017)]|nr:hypothetical protein BVY03_01820 [bacterium K02(2017)]
MLKFTLIIISFLFSFESHAQDQGVVEIDKIIIVDQNQSKKTTEPSSVINIKSSAPKTETIAEVVNKISGVHIRRFGGLEAATSVSIRGSSHDQVSLFLDGVSLDSASAQGIGLGQIPTSAIAKIEVYKSFTPTEFGLGALGGLINISSQAIESGLHQRYGLGGGSFFTLDSLAEVTRGGDKHDFMWGIEYRRTKGNFSFLDNNGTPLNINDDQSVKRQNNEHQFIHPYFKWVFRIDGDKELKWIHHFFRKDSGVPGLGTFQSQNSDLSQTEWVSSLQYQQKNFIFDQLEISNNLYTRWIKSQFTDLGAEIGLGAAQDNDNQTLVMGDRLMVKYHVNSIVQLKFGTEYIFESFWPKDYIATTSKGSNSRRQQINVSLEPHFHFFNQRLNFYLMGQSLNAFYNINNNDPSLNTVAAFFSARQENQFLGSAAVNYQLFKFLTLKSSISRLVRQPKFYELFGDQGSVVGNPQLISENGIKYDVGFLFQSKWKHHLFKKVIFDAQLFSSHINDLIQFEVASGFARAANVGKTKTLGIEVNLNTKIWHYFNFSTNYTFQKSQDRSVFIGNQLIGRPKHEINTELVFKFKGFSANVATNLIDDQFLDSLNTQRINNRLIVNMGMGYLYKERIRFGIEAKNLTGSQIVDAVGFPLPGRSYFGRVDVFFN